MSEQTSRTDEPAEAETSTAPGAGPGEAATSAQTAQAGSRDQAEGDRTQG